MVGAAIGGAILGQGLQDTGSFMSGAQQHHYNREMQDREHDWQEKMRATAYQTKVGDLRSAGLNPMLAVGNSPLAGYSGSSAGGVSTPKSGIKADLVNAMATAKQLKQMDANTRILEAEAKIKEADAEHRTSNKGKSQHSGQEANKGGVIGLVESMIHAWQGANDRIEEHSAKHGKIQDEQKKAKVDALLKRLLKPTTQKQKKTSYQGYSKENSKKRKYSYYH